MSLIDYMGSMTLPHSNQNVNNLRKKFIHEMPSVIVAELWRVHDRHISHLANVSKIRSNLRHVIFDRSGNI